jgi:hypothetical protein
MSNGQPASDGENPGGKLMARIVPPDVVAGSEKGLLGEIFGVFEGRGFVS